MKMHCIPSTLRGVAFRLLFPLLICCALALACVAQAMGATGQTSWSSQVEQLAAGDAAAILEQCVTTGEQLNRSATFSGEMTAIAGTARMTMRIEVQERMPGEELFHTVSAPGLGVWRSSAPGVKIYQYVKQVTNLSSPALYRALVRFHWLNDGGHVIRRVERRTSRCTQPTSVLTPAPTTPGATSPSTTPSPSTPSSSPSA
jgi:hypothetical protein